MPSRIPLLDERALGRTLVRMATEIVERAGGTDSLVLVGIQRRGVELADRLKRLIDQSEGSAVPVGKLDITLYRDDLQTVGPRPVVGETRLPNLDGRTVVIVDDVLYTGRAGSCSACSSTAGDGSSRSRRTSWAPRRARSQRTGWMSSSPSSTAGTPSSWC